MNWGKGIILGMVVFMLFIISMCVYMFMVPADEYDHQYYEKGLTFNHDYDLEVQVVKDHAKPIIQISKDDVVITFINAVKGKVTFARPSDATFDRTFTLVSGPQNEVIIPTKGIAPGRWRLVFNWKAGEKEYLYQEEIYVQ